MASKDIKIKIKAVNKTRRAFMAVTAGLGGIAKAAFSMKTALGLAAGVAGLGYLAKKSLDATDEMAKMSRAVGVSVETLQRYHHAANLGGLTTKQLDKAVQKFAINIQEVSTGVGMAKDAFDQYGIAATNTDGSLRAVEAVMDDVAEAMAGITNKTALAAFAYDMFGGRGAAMVNVLKDGKEALRDAMREADTLGLVMSTKMVQGVEDANDALTRLGSYLGSVFNRVVATLSPIIQTATDSLREFVQMKINKAGGIAEFSKDIAISVLEATKSIISGFNMVINSVISLSNRLGGVADIWAKLFGDQRMTKDVKKEIDRISDSIVATVISSEKWYGVSKKGAIEAILGLRAQQEVLEELIAAGDTYTPKGDTPFININPSLDAVSELLLQLEKIDMGDTTITAAAVDNPTNTAHYEALRISKIQHDKAMREQQERAEQSGLAYLARHNAAVLEQTNIIQGIQNGQEDMAEGRALAHQNKMIEMTHQYLAKQSAIKKAAAANDIDTLQESGKKTVSALSGHYKWAFNLHKSFAIKDALIDTYKAVSTAMASAPPPLNYGLAAVALAQGVANVQTLRSTQFREKGGPVSSGSPYIVGERGRELFVPNQAGTIVPSDQLGGGGNYTINISANDTEGFDELLTKRRGTLMSLINQALNENGRPALA